jgi:hypothetical protein
VLLTAKPVNYSISLQVIHQTSLMAAVNFPKL